MLTELGLSTLCCGHSMLKGGRNQTNPKAPSVFLFVIYFTLVSLVLIVFHGFGNCEDLVTGASERAMSKAKHVSGVCRFF